MDDAETIYRAMLLMAKANALAKDAHKTEWLKWRSLRLAYYPVSRTHRWFGPDGPINKLDVLIAINKEL